MNDFANEHYRRLLDALPCYVTLQDRELNILWCNESYQRDFGLPYGKTCFELYGTDKAKCSDCPVEKTFLDGLIHSREMTVKTKDDHRTNMMVYSSPVRDDNGKIISVLETAVNVTSVKDMQKQLILLGQTVAGMAHSIKNIMMGLEGGIYVVNKGIEDKSQDEIKEGWEMVLLNFDKISHIVKDILYCSKDREPNLQEIRPNDVVREVYKLFKSMAGSYAIEIRLDLDGNVRDAVIDPAGLHTVLSNLVTNAMDACKIDLWKDEHLVEVRTRKGKNGSTIIEVADNGIGIGKDLKAHVFEDFFSSKGDKGTGLGLMVTQKILREHGGKITFRSRPGRGTTFVATFPRKELPNGAGQ
ncbi:MAG: PAS domain-containing protein [Desulfomonile tiedjei]|uniref:histidine kinase n=1 Tax=Desulfomonile tiedjei TaxID=2358 RepID=A0A9D6V7C8_9BACT|nr:PAS domain-containing protein [Desulfomonile tiedjei]